jgi:hypothetical protein
MGEMDFSPLFRALETVNKNLEVINNNVGIVDQKVEAVAARQDAVEVTLNALMEEFREFVARDARQKNLQLAETRLGNLRQELQIKYGYYGEIRRMAPGILQAVDTGVVDKETIKFLTEEVMIKAPGYWLGAALVTLASWLRDDKATCDKALREALRRDDYKTTLFFMLVSRRLARDDATLAWLRRYFMHQDPQALDREFITILEGIATGVFQPAARLTMMEHVGSWVQQLTQGERFVNEQKALWLKHFEASKPAMEENKYPLLKKYAENWNELANALQLAKTYQILQDKFNAILSSSADLSETVKAKLDGILTQLVSSFDDEELPLRKEIRLNELIIEKNGDKDAAQAVMAAEEKVFEEKVDLLQMLSNAAFNPQAAGVSKATQALAVSISQPWILEAFGSFTAKARSGIPSEVRLSIDGFRTSTKDGSDEKELLSRQDKFYQTALEEALRSIPFPVGTVAIGALVVIGGFLIKPLLGVIIFLIAAILVMNSIKSYKGKQEAARDIIRERQEEAIKVLRGCLAEVVDYRNELLSEDKNAEDVWHLLTSITPQDFSSVSRDTARNMIFH